MNKNVHQEIEELLKQIKGLENVTPEEIYEFITNSYVQNQ